MIDAKVFEEMQMEQMKNSLFKDVINDIFEAGYLGYISHNEEWINDLEGKRYLRFHLLTHTPDFCQAKKIMLFYKNLVDINYGLKDDSIIDTYWRGVYYINGIVAARNYIRWKEENPDGEKPITTPFVAV